MPGKIFVNYRRDDARDMAARIRDRLAQTFGDANVFMDVDNLMAGQRFDLELERALSQTDVFLAVIGPRWLELFAERQASGERDYVREEIAGALQRGIVVIPVLIERTPLPRADALPEDIRDLALHQTHEVAHARFGRDVADLIDAIRLGRKAARAPAGTLRWVGAVALAALVLGGAGLVYQLQLQQEEQGKRAEAEKQVTLTKAPVAKPLEMKPLVAKPLEIKPLEMKPLVAKPLEIKPLVAKPLEIKPLEIKPLEKRPAKVVEPAAAITPSRDARPLTVAEERALKPGDSFRECDNCPEMVVVPAGEFMMGSPPGEEHRFENEGPQRKVTIARPFAVGRYEVTFAQWDRCVAPGGCKRRPDDDGAGRGTFPVRGVSWHEIIEEYLPWLSRETGKGYRLLTEAEWEFAARGGNPARYHSGDDPRVVCAYENIKSALYCWDDRGAPRPVGSFRANAFGLYDMLGNVSELVEDCWNKTYGGAPVDGTAWIAGDCQFRVVRGGNHVSDMWNLRSAARRARGKEEKWFLTGFRVARTLD